MHFFSIKKTFFAFAVFAVFSHFGFSKERTIKAGYLNYDSPFMKGDADGKPKSGFGYEYLKKLSIYGEWNYDYVYGSWSDLYDKLETGEIDILVGVGYSQDRSKTIDFPRFSLGTEYYSVFTNHSVNMGSDFSYLRDKVVAVGKNSNASIVFNKWVKDNNIQCKVSYYEDDKKRLSDFNNGLVDAIVDTNINMSENWHCAYNIGFNTFFVGVSKYSSVSLSEINGILRRMYIDNPYYLNGLNSRYFSELYASKTLTDIEYQWLADHKKIVFGCMLDNLPLADYDFKLNRPTGIIYDFVENMKEKLDLDNCEISFEFYKSKNQLEDAIKSGKVDVFFPVYDSFYYGEINGLIQTDSFLARDMMLVYNGTFDSSKMTSIAVADETPFSGYYVRTLYPEAKIVECNTTQMALSAVKNNMAGIAVIPSSKLSVLSKREFHRLNKIQLSESADLCFAVRNTDGPLVLILNRGIMSFEKSRIQGLITNYMADSLKISLPDVLYEYSPYIIASIIIFVILLAVLIYAIDKLIQFADIDTVSFLQSKNLFFDGVMTAIKKSDKDNTPFSLLLIDLDNFKKINEIYGRDCGNGILRIVARIVSRSVKRNDEVFRWEKEKIFVILDCNPDIAAGIAERIRREIDKESLIYKEAIIDITATIGIASYHKGLIPEALIQDAVRKVEQGKAGGKNKVVR